NPVPRFESSHRSRELNAENKHIIRTLTSGKQGISYYHHSCPKEECGDQSALHRAINKPWCHTDRPGKEAIHCKMSTKAPIYLKRGSRKGKKEKLRDILSSDMISPPLGDFRHTIHIGSSGGENDLFGDLSFLQGKFHLLPGRQGHSLSQRCSQYGEPFQFTRTASVCGHPPSSDSSPLLKNAISLPVIGGVQALMLPASSPASDPAPDTSPDPAPDTSPDPGPVQTEALPQAPPPKPPRLHLDDKASHLSRDLSAQSSGTPSPLTPPSSRASPDARRCLQDPEEGPQEQSYLSHAGSLLSLHLDLGPSILDDVLQIMDKHSMGGLNGSCVHGGRQEIYT
ncbi:hypothetical protein JZ751_006837, partial [Albula glossodonta]